MITIGILGASSQVGSSLALFLRDLPEVRLVCFIRSGYSQVFFELFGIPCDYADMGNERELAEKLGAMDVILDFRYPAVQSHEILPRSKADIAKTLQAMKRGATYFYMSSISAYGMPDFEKWIRNYRVPRTSYAYIKRSLEKFTVQAGRKAGIKIYNFRLGQVHGFLQSVSNSFRKKLSETNIALIDGKPEDPVNIIFIQPLGEAILQCIRGERGPGLYTLVSQPQWTLQELYTYYNEQYNGGRARLEFRPAGGSAGGRRTLFQRVIGLVKPYRALAETYVLMRFPKLAVAIKGRFRQQQLAELRAPRRMEYIDYNLLGTPPLAMISGMKGDPESIRRMETDMERNYYKVIESTC